MAESVPAVKAMSVTKPVPMVKPGPVIAMPVTKPVPVVKSVAGVKAMPIAHRKTASGLAVVAHARRKYLLQPGLLRWREVSIAVGSVTQRLHDRLKRALEHDVLAHVVTGNDA
jgi:hypothetical protein